MKKSELSLRADERLRFDASAFRANDLITYRQNGSWQFGILEVPPVVRDGKVVLKLQNNPVDVETHVPPKKVGFSPGEQVMLEGRTYTIRRSDIDTDGSPVYELYAPARGGVGGVPLEPAKTLERVSEASLKTSKEIVAAAQLVENTKTSVENKITSLVSEIKKLQGEKRIELTNRLLELEVKVKEMQAKLPTVSHETQGAALSLVVEAIRDLKIAIDKEVRKLDADIAAAIGAEGAGDSAQARQGFAEAVSNRFAREAQVLDAKEQKDYKARKKKWDKETADLEKHEKEIERLKGVLAAAKKAQPKDQAAIDAADTALKTAEAITVVDPGDEPELEKPSEDAENKTKLLMKLFKELQASTDQVAKDMVAAVAALRKKDAAPKADFDPRADKDLYEASTAAHLEAVMNEWKALTEKKKKFNFEDEVQALKDKAAELAESIHSAKNTALETELANVENGTVGVVGSGINTLDKANPNAKDHLIDLMRKLGNIEVKLFEGALKKAARPEPRVEHVVEKGLVDIPKNTMRDMLRMLSGSAEQAMSAAYDTVIDGGGSRGSLENSLVQLIDKVSGILDTGNPTIRQQLAEAGIKNWDAFRARFKNEIAQNMSLVLLEKADSDVRNLLCQGLSDIDPNLRFSDKFQYSAISQMKGAVALRMLINTGVIGGVYVGTNLLLKLIPAPRAAKSIAIGGVVGLARAGVQRLLGRDGNWFKKQSDEAQAAAEKKKMELIKRALINQSFNISSQFNPGAADAMAHLFSTTLREVTREKDAHGAEKTLTVGDIVLSGDAVCMYHEALTRAAEDEGVDFTDQQRVRIEFARAIHALHNNKKMAVEVQTPALVRGLKWITDAYAGRVAAKPGEKIVASTTPGSPALGGGQTRPGEVSLERQLIVSGVTGATVSYLLMNHTTVGRIGVGGSIAALKGMEMSHASDTRAADRKGREQISTALQTVDAIIERAVSAIKSGGNPQPDDVNKLRAYRDVFSAVLQGRHLERGLEPLDKPVADYFKQHEKDVAYLLSRNKAIATTVESAQREISRSGVLERAGFMGALATLQESGKKLSAEAAKNGLDLEAKRWGKRLMSGLALGLVGAGASFLVGEGADQIRKHFSGEPVANQTAQNDQSQDSAVDRLHRAPRTEVHPLVSPEPEVAPYVLRGDPVENLLEKSLVLLKGDYARSGVFDTLDAQRLSNVANNVANLGTPGEHHLSNFAIPADLKKIYTVDMKAGTVTILNEARFKHEILEPMLRRAELKITNANGADGAWEVGRRNWHKYDAITSRIDVKHIEPPAEKMSSGGTSRGESDLPGINSPGSPSAADAEVVLSPDERDWVNEATRVTAHQEASIAEIRRMIRDVSQAEKLGKISSDEAGKLIAQHERNINLLKQEQQVVLQNIDDVLHHRTSGGGDAMPHEDDAPYSETHADQVRTAKAWAKTTPFVANRLAAGVISADQVDKVAELFAQRFPNESLEEALKHNPKAMAEFEHDVNLQIVEAARARNALAATVGGGAAERSVTEPVHEPTRTEAVPPAKSTRTVAEETMPPAPKKKGVTDVPVEKPVRKLKSVPPEVGPTSRREPRVVEPPKLEVLKGGASAATEAATVQLTSDKPVAVVYSGDSATVHFLNQGTNPSEHTVALKAAYLPKEWKTDPTMVRVQMDGKVVYGKIDLTKLPGSTKEIPVFRQVVDASRPPVVYKIEGGELKLIPPTPDESAGVGGPVAAAGGSR